MAACSIIKKQLKGKLTGSSRLREADVEHKKYVKGTTMYPLEHNLGNGILCTVTPCEFVRANFLGQLIEYLQMLERKKNKTSWDGTYQIPANGWEGKQMGSRFRSRNTTSMGIFKISFSGLF